MYWHEREQLGSQFASLEAQIHGVAERLAPLKARRQTLHWDAPPVIDEVSKELRLAHAALMKLKLEFYTEDGKLLEQQQQKVHPTALNVAQTLVPRLMRFTGVDRYLPSYASSEKRELDRLYIEIYNLRVTQIEGELRPTVHFVSALRQRAFF